MGRRTERPWEHARIRPLAEVAFAKHVVVRESHGAVDAWLCKRPGTNQYWFRVIIAHNAIILTGDIDEIVVVPYTPDVLAWMKGALTSITYFAEKVPRHIEITEFDQELVKRALGYEKERLEAEDADSKTEDWWATEVEDLAELMHMSFDCEHDFNEAYHDSSLYRDELPSVTGLSTGFYWTLEALRWFCLQRPLAL